MITRNSKLKNIFDSNYIKLMKEIHTFENNSVEENYFDEELRYFKNIEESFFTL